MMRKIGSDNIRKAYQFLCQAETEGRTFTLNDLQAASGWSEHTFKAIRSKKISHLLLKVNGGYQSTGIKMLNEETFCRLCSQSVQWARDPYRPRLNPKVEALVIKAREAALAAVQYYNNPTSMFRSGNYIVLMIIAYTSLFHAIFERDGVDYIAREKDGTPRKVAGEPMLWDVQKCVDYYEKGHTSPLVVNINLMVPIRHKIEHRFMPELDAHICGHCQSLLTNFEQILIKEFTPYYALNASLALALQFSTQRSTETINALRRLQSEEYQELRKFISEFHANLQDDILGDPSFAFRVWLIPKTARDARSSDMSIEYLPADAIDPDQLRELEKSIVAIKRSVGEARNTTYLLAGQVSQRVAAAIGKRFHHSSDHVRACKYHKVRPSKDERDKTRTDNRYCVWDATFQQYVYTEAWVDFLVKEYSDEEKYNLLRQWREPT